MMIQMVFLCNQNAMKLKKSQYQLQQVRGLADRRMMLQYAVIFNQWQFFKSALALRRGTHSTIFEAGPDSKATCILSHTALHDVRLPLCQFLGSLLQH